MFPLCRSCGEEMNKESCNNLEEGGMLNVAWAIHEVRKAL